ncbi:MAG TPA: o-succinylbenzoate synthase [Phycisphaerales bacterium]|nr:o-succinylbenzoate synthase [Phycisphaerales bacterium]
MKIVDCKIKLYDLPLARPITIKGNTITRRKGAVLILRSEERFVGYGEAAPLEGLHPESLDEVICQLSDLKSKIVGLDVGDGVFDFTGAFDELLPKGLSGSVRLAVEMAMWDMYGQGKDAFAGMEKKNVLVNSLLVPGGGSIVSDAAKLVDAGYKSIKVKVGRGDVAKDIEMIRELKNAVEEKAALRLDANRSWDIGQAVAFCREVGTDGIEYVEEPVGDIKDHGAFFEQTGLPIALDETLVECGCDIGNDLSHVGAFILKPSLLGGFDRTAEFIRFAKENGIKPVISCTFQSSLTLCSFALFAAKMGLSDIAHGIGTFEWLGDDLLVDPVSVTNGSIKLADVLKSRGSVREDLLDLC